MINKANMRAWVAALRSGTYKQGKHQLTSLASNGEVRHCCLGVACAIADVAKRGYGHDAEITWYRCDVDLPRSVMDWLGVEQADPLIAPEMPASVANDECGEIFAAIADRIERFYQLGN